MCNRCPFLCRFFFSSAAADLTLVWGFLCLQFQPASTKCQRTSLSTKAATWLSPVLPMADRNLPSPGGCSTPQVRTSQWWSSSCDVSLILSQMHLSKGSWQTQPPQLLKVGTLLALSPHLLKSVVETKASGFMSQNPNVSPRHDWWRRSWQRPGVVTKPCWWKTLLSLSIIVSSISVLDIFHRLHLSPAPGIWATMDDCALPPLSVWGEPFVCIHPLSHMAV